MNFLISNLLDYFLNLEPLLMFFWTISIITTLVFLVQAILSLLGIGGADDLNADFDGNLDGDGSSFSWLSFRNMINFLMGFGWSGVLLYHQISNVSLLVFVALVVGISFVAMFAMIMRQFHKLEENNTFNIQHTLNKTAQVYLTIPAMKQGKGKIHISVNGSLRELDALSESDLIETGSMVKIIKVIDDTLLTVEKI